MPVPVRVPTLTGSPLCPPAVPCNACGRSPLTGADQFSAGVLPPLQYGPPSCAWRAGGEGDVDPRAGSGHGAGRDPGGMPGRAGEEEARSDLGQAAAWGSLATRPGSDAHDRAEAGGDGEEDEPLLGAASAQAPQQQHAHACATPPSPPPHAAHATTAATIYAPRTGRRSGLRLALGKRFSLFQQHTAELDAGATAGTRGAGRARRLIFRVAGGLVQLVFGGCCGGLDLVPPPSEEELWEEALVLVQLALPVSLTTVCRIAVFATDAAFVGQLGTTQVLFAMLCTIQDKVFTR